LSVSVSVSLILPLQIEIIVPISLSPLQKHVYKGVLEKNAELLEAILESRKKRLKAATRA
jgi:SNF2 family DNA or RNA helicase